MRESILSGLGEMNAVCRCPCRGENIRKQLFRNQGDAIFASKNALSLAERVPKRWKWQFKQYNLMASGLESCKKRIERRSKHRRISISKDVISADLDQYQRVCSYHAINLAYG